MSSNIPEFSVSELAGKVKKTLEDTFGYVRVRGELGRVTKAGSGHVYLDLKDERAVLSSVIWKGAATRLAIAPEQGMEVIATGRMTTFPGQSRYQLVIDTLEPAGVGALMALFEQRKKALAAEGLFTEERKKPIPFLPEVIGVVTSPTGAVIRDILHRLRDRFPRHVIVWPSLVQGDQAPKQIIAGIEGFNRLPKDGPIPRPDVLIVGRGGGSLEDLWCFNDEGVARAAAASEIPLISAVGHETDTTLIDFVADRRAPTPTAAAEMAVPVRLELAQLLDARVTRLAQGTLRLVEQRQLALTSAARGLGRPEGLIEPQEQQLDRATERLRSGLLQRLDQASVRLARAGAGLTPSRVKQGATLGAERLMAMTARLRRWSSQALDHAGHRVKEQARLLESYSYRSVLSRGFALVRDAEGHVIRRAADAQTGQQIDLTFNDGQRTAIINGAAKPASPAAKKSAAKKPSKKTTQKSQSGLFD